MSKSNFPVLGVLVEAEEFDDYGGWVLDSQFEMEMGSPYLLAHGNGRPVADATTTVLIPFVDHGTYKVWVRAKDWVPGHHPGRFQVIIDDDVLETEFGANDSDWSWEFGGSVELPPGEVKVALHDLTGFCGRCDAIFLTLDDGPPPEFIEPIQDAERAWRRRLRGLPSEPIFGGTFDVIVVGGGLVGAAAALTAARLGERVAVIQDRPYLGGNASVEIGLSPRGVRGPLIEELQNRDSEGDLDAMHLLEALPNAKVFLEHTIYNTVIIDDAIVSADARHARSGRETRFSAPLWIDCSGKCILGLLCGAETLNGRECRAEYNETLAPRRADNMHHGNTVFFRTRMADSPVPFPKVPWAIEVAKDFANLSGQLITAGFENGPGPTIDPPCYVPDRTAPRRLKKPDTHFWEYGQWLDPYTQGEVIRDHLLRAIYGTFFNVKTMEAEKYANLELEHVAFVAGQGGFRRYKGDHVLSEPEIKTHKYFPDAVVQNGFAICLHYPGHPKYDFRPGHWGWDDRDGKDYDIPFRCLYSSNISNLMMAGKHISVTHVVGASIKLMGNGGQHAIATAAAAHLCRKYQTTPRGVGNDHMRELQKLSASVTGRDLGEANRRTLAKL